MSSESERRFRRELFVGNAVKARHRGKGRWMSGRVIAKVRTGSGSGFLYTVKYRMYLILPPPLLQEINRLWR
jgi:hypothetical protein